MSATPPDRPRRSGLIALDAIVAVCVVVISVVSLWVAVGTAHIQQRTLAAGVWPYLQAGYSDTTPEGTRMMTFAVSNAGVGPAVVRWFTLEYQGHEYDDPVTLLRDCCAFTGQVIKSKVSHRVLMSRQMVSYFSVPPKTMSNQDYQRIDRAVLHIYAHACYCSVLDECWLFDQQYERRTPISSCPPNPSAF